MWNALVNRWCLGITALMVLLLYLWSPLAHYAHEIFWASLIFLGIPHGALDHLIHLQDSGTSPGQMKNFYIKYLSLMVVTFLMWFIWPTVSFVTFLIISAYHFGQSQLFYLKTDNVIKSVLFLSWGCLILSGIIAFNFTQCQEMFSSLGWLQLEWSTLQLWIAVSGVSAMVTLTILVYLWVKGIMNTKEIAMEFGLLILLTMMAYGADAVLTFAVYFGLWHSFRSLVLEYQALSWLKGLSQFVKKLVPYTLVSVLGLVAINLLADWYFGDISPLMVFIMVVSALTVPHLLVMHQLYQTAETKMA